jgi:phosphoglycerol transferase MdoB-like AlkP superfamily enzyme
MTTSTEKSKVPFIIRQLAFWLICFAYFRLLFISFNFSKILDGELPETLKSFVYAIRLDLSTACIISAIPFILWGIHQFYNSKLLVFVNRFINILCICIVVILSVSNLKIYNEWGVQLTFRALGYTLYPKEMLAFISTKELLFLLLLIAVSIYIAIKTYLAFSSNFTASFKNKKTKFVYVLLMPVLLIVGARGGFQLAPVNESSSYYSTVQMNNHAATNNIWFLAHSIEDAMKTKNMFSYMDTKTAQNSKENLYAISSNNNQKILKTNKPNIVLIILESWTADIIEALDGEKNVTPHFNELTKEGLLFTQMYSSGSRTEQGLISILSGFPAQPNHSIITNPGKAEKLPSINYDLEKLGYYSSFYYGGEIEFANMKSYLLNTHFKKIIDKHNFEAEQLNSKWGAHDEYVLAKQLQELKAEQKPFFSIVLTLSTHEPFEVTMQTPFNGKEKPELFKKAAYYTDNCLFNYFNEAKKQEWFTNTLFVLVADHGHNLPKNRSQNLPEGHHITAMLLGGALTDDMKGKTINTICNQNDLPAIILSQLNVSINKYEWSKNVFDSNSKQFAYYANENVLGWITQQENIVYSFSENKVEELQPKTQKVLNDTLLNQAKAYLQTLNKQYLDY